MIDHEDLAADAWCQHLQRTQTVRVVDYMCATECVQCRAKSACIISWRHVRDKPWGSAAASLGQSTGCAPASAPVNPGCQAPGLGHHPPEAADTWHCNACPNQLA